MKALLSKFQLLFIVIAVLAISGCAAPTQRLSDSDRVNVKSAKINSTVDKTKELFLLAPGSSVGLMFGAVGALATTGAREDARIVFTTYVEKNSISIEKIVREEIEAALRNSAKILIVDSQDTSVPTVNITVQQYGFGVTHLLSSKVVPVLMIKCDLVDNSGKVLWSASDRLLPSIAHPLESTTWESMRDNPKVIEDEWRKASAYLGKKIVDEL